jgi:hypothetical protein
MAAPAPVIASAPPAAFDWHHPGKPDLTDPAVRAALPDDLRVALSDVKHPFIAATPCLSWRSVPGAAPTDPPVGKSIPQSEFDLMCTVGGFSSQWLRSEENILLLSHVPEYGAKMVEAWTRVGGLSLAEEYGTLRALTKAIRVAKLACVGDSRLVLIQDAFFEDERRPGSGAGAAAVRDWMYCFTGEMLTDAEGRETEALALLRRAVEPKRKSSGRDLPRDTYCRFLSSLKTLAGARSTFIGAQLGDLSTPNDEVAEYVADQWRQLVASGYPFDLSGKMAQKNLEVNAAESLVNGTEAEKGAAFKLMFGGLLKAHPLLSKCIVEDGGVQSASSLLGNFEQVAGMVLPGVTWSSAHCMQSVEHEMVKMRLQSLIDTWGDSPLEIISCLRAHLKQERAVASIALKSGGEGDDKAEVLSASGAMASRDPAYLETKKQMESSQNFLEGLDTMLQSGSKLWYAKAIRQLPNHRQITGGDVMESASKYVVEWNKYWPMAISRNRKGEVHPEVQGEEFDEEDVTHLLSGNWHLVRWIRLNQMMEKWMDNTFPDPDDSYCSFTTLHAVSLVLFKTMKLLRLAQDGESEDLATTCTGFMEHIKRLERRSRGLPRGSEAQEQAIQNVVHVLMSGLKEFGARWSKQWAKPVNYTESLISSFADESCFIMRKVDRLDKVADTIHELREVLPIVFHGGMWEKHNGKSQPSQRPNPPVGELLDQGEYSPGNLKPH